MKYLFATCLTVLLATTALADSNVISFPENYRSTYTNYLSMDRSQNPDQVIRMFANDIAMQGPGEDGKLPYGSILVAEVYKAKKDENDNVIQSTLGQRIQGKFALVAIMQREKGFGANVPEALRNGDWDFAAFKPDGSPADKDLNACRACHLPLVDMNFLFSYEHF